VRSYQQSKGLVVDGVAGRQTATSLGIWGTASTPAPSGGGSCTPPTGVPAAARQVVVVTASGSRADVDLLVHDGSRWTCSRMNMSGRVGSNGVRTLAQRRSGDGTTPGGVFPLGWMTAPDGQTFQFFGNGVNPGVRGTWRQVKRGDCWGATPNTADYNTLVTRSAANCQSPDEFLINFQGAYSRAALIGANMGPNRSGNNAGEPALAAAIFLHRHSYDASGNSRPTAGCVSLNNDNLIYVLQRLAPGQAYFVIR
jgi:L,D-peptidoglycan transpeptidase YkuD (ErfK/YbiS/YcfS/YnhG family)